MRGLGRGCLKEGGKVPGHIVNVGGGVIPVPGWPRIFRFMAPVLPRLDENGREAHGMGRGEIPGKVFEEDRTGWLNAILAAETIIGAPIRFRMVSAVFNTEEAIEQGVQFHMARYSFGVAPGPVGVDISCPRQVGDRRLQPFAWRDRAEVDFVDMVEEVGRVHPVQGHEPLQGCAVFGVVLLLEPARFHRIDPQEAGDEVGHPRVNLGKQVAVGGVEGIVEIKHPVIDMAEGRGHGVSPRPCLWEDQSRGRKTRRQAVHLPACGSS